jgi:hypothetical protein
MHNQIARLKVRIARAIGGRQELTFTQGCARCRTLHPSNHLRLVGRV